MSASALGRLEVASAEDEAVRSGAGIVTVFGTASSDNLVGGAAADILWGRGGDDSFDGGAGLDTVVYMEATKAVVADLARQQVSFPNQRALAERLVSIEGVETGSGADVLTGSGADNLLLAGAGNDRVAASGGNDLVRGGRGSDTLDGGSGRDTVDYSDHAIGVTVNLAQGFAQVAGATERDRLTGFEDVTGGEGDDSLVGTSGANRVAGGAGNDAVYGGGGNDVLSGGGFEAVVFEHEYDMPDWSVFKDDGADVLNGGAGIDTVVIQGHEAHDVWFGSIDALNPAATVDLKNGTITYGGRAAADQLISIENVTATAADDTIYGSDVANVIRAGDGRNYVAAGGGNDIIHGGILARSNGYDDPPRIETLLGQAGDDTIFGNGGFGFLEDLGSYNEHRTWLEYLEGGSGNDRIHAGVGNAMMEGGSGADEFRFDCEQRLIDNRLADYWRSASMESEHATIIDFRPDEGDRLVIGLNAAYGDSAIRWGGEKPRVYEHGWDEDGTDSQDHFELSWERESSEAGVDTVVSMQLPDLDDDYYVGPYMTIRLADYAAPLSEADFVFV